MIGLPAGTRIWLAAGITDMRAGMNGLAARVETALTENPCSGHVFVFRGRRGDIIKVLWWTGDGLCLLAKRLEKGRLVWPQATSGSGMESGLVSRVFDLFTQAARTPDRSSGGLGLGLALVKNLTELHGGQVSCRSGGLGEGSTFSVYLPREADSVNKLNRSHVDHDAGLKAGPLRILLVDDNEDAASMLAMLLGASGHHVMVEHSALKALERAKKDAPQVCILDIGLPEMDGYELASRMRAQPETADALLIAITGYGQDQDREQATAAGFGHHLVKPADINRLSTILADLKRA